MGITDIRRRVPRAVAVAAVSAVCLAFATVCGAQSIKTTVGFYPGALLSLPAFIAEAQGFFKANGLDVTLISIPNGAAMTAAVASSSIQFGNNSYDNLAIAVDKGLPVKAVIGGTVKVPFALVVRDGVPLPHLKDGYPMVIEDLIGKKWGVIGLGISVHFMSQTLVTGSGHAVKDVTFIAVGLPNTARPALKNKSIDTYFSPEPLPSIAAAKGEGTVVLNLVKGQGPAQLKDLNYNGWWATDGTIKNNPEVVKRFVRANEQAFCWYSNPRNLDDVVAIVKKYVPVPDLTDDQYTTMIKDYLPTYGVNITASSIKIWQDMLIAHGQIEKPMTRADLVAPSAPSDFKCP